MLRFLYIKNISYYLFVLFFLLISLLVILKIDLYQLGGLYLIFSLSTFFLLKKTIYDFKNFYLFFFSFFLFLGFFLSFSLNVIFIDLDFVIIINYLSFLNLEEKIELLYISIIVNTSLILVYYIPNNFLFPNYKNLIKKNIYKKHFSFFSPSIKSLFFFNFFLLIISFINYYFGIYMRGVDYNYNSIIKIFFSFLFQLLIYVPISYYIFVSFVNNRQNYFRLFLILVPSVFIISISILSRYFIVNTFIFLITFFLLQNYNSFKKFNLIKFFLFLTTILMVFIINIKIINHLRVFEFTVIKEKISVSEKQEKLFKFNSNPPPNYNNEKLFKSIIEIFLNRFVGINTLSQVIKIENKGYDLIYSAIRPSHDNKYFFDELIHKYSLGHNYVDDHTNIKKNKFLSTVGIIGFLYYSNSKIFIFISLILISLIFVLFEKLMLYFTQNIFLNSYFIFFIVNKIIHFGYQPINIYKSIISIIFILVILNLFFRLVDNYKKNF